MPKASRRQERGRYVVGLADQDWQSSKAAGPARIAPAEPHRTIGHLREPGWVYNERTLGLQAYKGGRGMRLRDATFALFGAMLASSQAIAGTYSSSQFSKIIAADIVPNHDDLQLYFSVRAGTFWSTEIDEVATADGVYYQYFGTAEILVGDARKILDAGDGIFMPTGTRFRLKPIGISPQRTYLQFLLSPTPQPEPADQSSGASVEVYRSPSPVPGLTRDQNLLSLARVPVPPQSSYDPPHRRTGAALHYVVSGVGAELLDGKAVVRGPGSVSYEPREVFYQWSNPGLKSLIYLVFNINSKDKPAVVEIEDRPADPFSTDSHLTWAIYCVGISMFLTLIVCATSMGKRGVRDNPPNDEG
jgi:mannose-6-phosphate isomerase-like protein (cupin superfamily)